MKFYFKWTNWQNINKVENIKDTSTVLGINITQKEGEFAKAILKIDIQEDLLSKECGSIFIEQDGKLKNIFNGRVINIPVSNDKNTMCIELISKPFNYELLFNTLVKANKTKPYYNELFNACSEETSILEARSALYYVDKVTGTLSLSDIALGEKYFNIGTQYVANSFKVQYASEPVDYLELKVNVSWIKDRSNICDIYKSIADKFDGYTFSAKDFVKKFNTIVKRLDNEPSYTVLSSSISKKNVETVTKKVGPYVATLKKAKLDGKLLIEAISYSKRVETFKLRIKNDHQGPDSGKVKKMSFNLGLVPTTAQTRRTDSFFLSEEGRDVMEHAFLRAKAHLSFASRVVFVSFIGSIEDFLDITVNDSVCFYNRLLGGNVEGKVIKTELIVTYNKKYIRLTLGVSIGKSSENNADLDLSTLVQTYLNEEKNNEKVKIINSIKVNNPYLKQQEELLQKEYGSLEEFESAANSLKTDLVINLRNPKSMQTIRSEITLDDVVFSSKSGVKKDFGGEDVS